MTTRPELAMKTHAVYPGGPACQPNCPGESSAYHDGYADGYENAEVILAAEGWAPAMTDRPERAVEALSLREAAMALRRFARHHKGCTAVTGIPAPCTCGLVQVVRALALAALPAAAPQIDLEGAWAEVEAAFGLPDDGIVDWSVTLWHDSWEWHATAWCSDTTEVRVEPYATAVAALKALASSARSEESGEGPA